jgi:signal transduction histidine kinase
MLKKMDKILNYVIVGAVVCIITMIGTAMAINNNYVKLYRDTIKEFVDENKDEEIVIEGYDESTNLIHYHKVEK